MFVEALKKKINGLFDFEQLPRDTPEEVKGLMKQAGVGKMDEDTFRYGTILVLKGEPQNTHLSQSHN